ncbi:MAG: aspartate aminotransferase family protein [Planctomycetota bacterium]
MAGGAYSLIPRKVKTVRTRHRRIITEIPPAESLPILKKLRKYEPASMSGQPPVVWDRAEGLHVFDRWGNKWLDWSSGVLVAGAGHGRREIANAIANQAERRLLHNYCFPSEIRAELAERLVRLAPKGLDKAFLLTTGAEAVECAIKLAFTRGRGRRVLVTFDGAFHGRTLGAQLAGGVPALKEWIPAGRRNFVQVPFPGDWRCGDRSFAGFEEALKKLRVKAKDVAAVMTETYQGGGASFMPAGYAKALRRWCGRHGALLIFDEVQAGFGRTGKLFGFEHYGVVPDLACFGKGISGSLPVSAVLGRAEIMDQYPPGSMTSTHTGNPVCCAAARANLEIIVKEKLHVNAARVGKILHDSLRAVRKKHRLVCGAAAGRGLVAGVHIVRPGTTEPDGSLARNIVERCMQKGLLMFSPVGLGGALLKIAPPLTSTKDAILEGVAVLDEAVGEAAAERKD